MLQELVDAHVLILADDSHFEKLKKSSVELTKRLQKSKEKTVGFIFAAIDSNISSTSDEIKEVQEIIIKGWSTFSSTAKDSAVNYIRAVILESLVALSKDDTYAALIWQVSRYIFKYYNLIGEEKVVVSKFLMDIGVSLQKKAEKEWSMQASPDLLGFKSELNSAAVDKGRLEAFLKSASVDKTYGGENPVNVSSYDSWHTYFSKRSAQGISEEVGKAIKNALNEVVANQKKLIEYFDKNVRAQEIRSKLIWWKEAGYSVVVEKRYKEISKEMLELILASDFSNFLDRTIPVSMEYFLLSSYEQFGGEESANNEISLKEFLDEINLAKEVLKKHFTQGSSNRSRLSLLEFINRLIWDQSSVGDFTTFTGIDSGKKVKRADLLLWLFSDNQVSKIINN